MEVRNTVNKYHSVSDEVYLRWLWWLCSCRSCGRGGGGLV